jgi:hypothetical protein
MNKTKQGETQYNNIKVFINDKRTNAPKQKHLPAYQFEEENISCVE